jgi:hypothetical protein
MTFGIAVSFPKRLEALDPQDRERVKVAVVDFALALDVPAASWRPSPFLQG